MGQPAGPKSVGITIEISGKESSNNQPIDSNE